MGVRKYAQNGEDKILYYLLREMEALPTPTENPTALEFGASGGRIHSNIYNFKRWFGWRLVQWDSNPNYATANGGQVSIETVTPENINYLMVKYCVPRDLAILSIDIDGLDWHVWKAIRPDICTPRLVVIEYNCHFPADVRAVRRKDAPPRTTADANFGASFRSMCELGEEKGYELVTEVKWINLIFAHRELTSKVPNIKRWLKLPELPHYILPGLDPTKFAES